jgi:hypothetical protein
MAKVTLRLMTLHCVKKQTTVGKDKILVDVNGQESGPFTIGKSGDDVNLSLGTTDFEGSIRITQGAGQRH